MGVEAVRRTVEALARDAYGRLLALLVVRSGELSACEDALGDALVRALARWPEEGIPSRPEAWLLVTARNRLRDDARRRRTALGALAAMESVEELDTLQHPIVDERVRLLFACAHPAIDASVHTPLMLQVVLGLDAATIAGAFLVSPAAMAKRLVRAKRKIAEARIPFELPHPPEHPERLRAVLEAIYGSHGRSWHLADGDEATLGRSTDALTLAEIVASAFEDAPEARGLAALLSYCEARRPARRNASGEMVPLSQQDPKQWDATLLARAEAHLRAVALRPTFERFQLEAALQAAHVRHRTSPHPSRAPSDERLELYRLLLERAPTRGAWLGYVAALADRGDVMEALACLESEMPRFPPDHQPLWALRASLLERLGRRSEARDAYRRAVALTLDPPTRRWLLRRLAELDVAHDESTNDP